MSRKDLEPGDIVAAVDSREQMPLTDLQLPWVTKKLATGDYSIVGLEHSICVERKSLADLVGCVGRDRDRFEACIQRMKAYETRVLVIEASLGAIQLGQWRGQIKPTQVLAALYSWAKYVTIFPAGDRVTAATVVSGILFSAARERWRNLQAFYEELKIETCKPQISTTTTTPATSASG